MIQFLARLFPAARPPRKSARAAEPFRPRVEPLDARLTPATFATQQLIGNQNLYSMVSADFNGDGRPDLAGVNTNNAVSVLLSTTAAGSTVAGFSAAASFAVSQGPSTVTVGDFDGDGRPDLAAVSRVYAASKVSVMRNTTPLGATVASFDSPQVFNVGANSNQVRAADMNGDGRSDLVTLGNLATVLYNTSPTGTDTLSFTGQQTVEMTGNEGLAVGDLDGDGRPDLAVTDVNGGTVHVRLNQTPDGALTPIFGTQRDLIVGAGPNSLAIGDFNGDGRADLVSGNSSGGGVSVLRNTMGAGVETPSFAAAQNFPLGNGVNSVQVGDFNGDGKIDVAAANNSYANSFVSVRENTTAVGASSVSFGGVTSFAINNAPNSLAVADFNADGRLDLATGNSNNAKVSVLRNTTGVTVTGQPVIGQFGNTGLARYNRITGTWTSLGANATAFAVAPNGNIVANLGPNGVHYYRPTTGWSQINSTPALAVGIDPVGNVYASFAGIGTALYRLSNASWGSLTSSVADKLAVGGNGDLVANLIGGGLYRYRVGGGWVSLSTPPATALAVGENGDVAANFGAYGVYRFKAGTWSLINSNAATTLAIGANGSVVASFGAFGVAKYIPYANGWQVLNGAATAPTLAMDINGNVFATLGGYGVYEYNPVYGFRQRKSNDAVLLGLG